MALIDCNACGRRISDRATSCPHCGDPRGQAANATPMGIGGYEYKSQAEFLGLPLVHIAVGVDPKTGRKRIAKGVIAIGDIAVGVFALGGVALGGLTLGGVSLGVAALGGLAIGAGAALGGLAIGYVAVGGLAIGYYALGGLAVGAHALGEGTRDPVAVEFSRQWFGGMVDQMSNRR
jgi:hypothetical protein